MTNPDHELQQIQAKLGTPPRRFGFLGLFEPKAYLEVVAPEWIHRDPLQRCFELRRQLLKRGRVTWGCIVQANGRLFEPGPADHPGELVYGRDPERPVPLESLLELASRLYRLKGTPQEDPRLRHFSAYLADELTRVFGLEVPDFLCSAGPCAVSSAFFARKHFPNQVLRQGFLPVLVLDEEPTAVMAVPSRYWPKTLLASWAEH